MYNSPPVPTFGQRLILASALLAGCIASAWAQETGTPAQRAAVVDVLRVPQPGSMGDIARARGAALAALDFDTLPIAHELLTDETLGTDAAYAMLGRDEPRALSMIFGTIPASGPNIQRIAFTWFLDRYDALDNATGMAARTAALRTLDPVRSTAHAEVALYVIGLTGSLADRPVLEFHLVNFRTGSRGMRNASDAALMRVGSESHIERNRQVLSEPLAPGASLQRGIALTLALQKAGFSGRTELVSAVCGHLQDQPLRDVDIRVDTGRSARLALNAIVDRVNITRLASGARTTEDWTAYCAALPESAQR